jgi:hypothetical protein
MTTKLQRLCDAIEVLNAAEHDKPYFVPAHDKDERKICNRLIRMGLLEKNPTSHHYRRTKEGDAVLDMLTEKTPRKPKARKP